MSTKINLKSKLEFGNAQIELEDTTIKIKGAKGEIKRNFKIPGINVKKENNSLLFTSKFCSRREKRAINTCKAHIKNMIKGVSEGFVYKLKICSGHFPITTEIKGKELIIKNFLGESIPRKAKILENVNVKINGTEIIVDGVDKESVGQTAVNIEKATQIKNRDRRVFMDGIWLIEKAGKPI